MQGSEIIVLFLSSSVIILIMVLFIVVFVVSYQKRVVGQRDEMKGMEIKHQQHLLEASVESQERERQRIASDLHDGLGSLLSAIRLRVLRGSTEDPKKQAEETAALISQGIDTVRRISHGLLPATLKTLGLRAALAELTDLMTFGGSIEMTFKEKGEPVRMESARELALFRVVQELVNNTIKHAEASEINLRVDWQSDRMQLVFKDNGKGFDVTAASGGLGLMNIETRTNILSGDLKVESAPGEGSTFSIEVPYTTNDTSN